MPDAETFGVGHCVTDEDDDGLNAGDRFCGVVQRHLRELRRMRRRDKILASLRQVDQLDR